MAVYETRNRVMLVDLVVGSEKVCQIKAKSAGIGALEIS